MTVENRRRSADLIFALKPGTRVKWCGECGYAFQVGGKSIMKLPKESEGCEQPMKEGTISEALADLRRPR